MGRLTNRLRRRRFGRGHYVLWGGRRYDIQVGSERDLRRCAMLKAFRYRYLIIAREGGAARPSTRFYPAGS